MQRYTGPQLTRYLGETVTLHEPGKEPVTVQAIVHRQKAAVRTFDGGAGVGHVTLIKIPREAVANIRRGVTHIEFNPVLGQPQTEKRPVGDLSDEAGQTGAFWLCRF